MAGANPKLYGAYETNKSVKTFQEKMDNNVTTLFQATVDLP